MEHETAEAAGVPFGKSDWMHNMGQTLPRCQIVTQFSDHLIHISRDFWSSNFQYLLL